jgi:NitT/TauT family transport system permease protein
MGGGEASLAEAGGAGGIGDRPGLRRSLRHPALLRGLSIFTAVVLWEIAGRVPVSPSFPTFGETAAATAPMIFDGSLPLAIGVTLVPLAIGIAISTVLGVGLGVAMGLDERAEWLGVPVFIVLQAAPLAALVPIIILAYGIGLLTKVLIVCIMSMPVIALNSFKAVRHAPAALLEMGRSFLGTRPQIIGKIILPAAAPVIFAGIRLGIASGFVGAVLAELLVTPTGVGDIITYSQSIADYPRMYGAIAAIIIVSVLMIDLLDRVEGHYFGARV